MLNFEKLCLAAGFNQEQTMVLMTGKNIEYSGELYSEEHKQKFMAKEIKAKILMPRVLWQRIKNGLYNDLDKDVGMWSNRSVIL